MGFLWQEYWGGLPFAPPLDRVSSELFTMTCPSWVALHGVAHGFVELRKLLRHDKAVIYKGVLPIAYALSLDHDQDLSGYFE